MMNLLYCIIGLMALHCIALMTSLHCVMMHFDDPIVLQASRSLLGGLDAPGHIKESSDKTFTKRNSNNNKKVFYASSHV